MLALFLVFSASAAINFQQVDANRLSVLKRGAVNTDNKMEREGGLSEYFVGGVMETSLYEFERRGLQRGTVTTYPWSGSAWENFHGGLAYRWADPAYPAGYLNARNYVQRNRWDRVNFNILSPAEKYDYLTGVSPSEPGSLTSHQWNLSWSEYQTTGTVATWQGICHGWSPASIYLPVPRHEVVFKYPQGDMVLSVDDIKALGSLYWANGKYESVFAGWRCNEATPATDSSGRVLDPKCFDVNPGDWHLALSNIVGIRKESFILDAAETSEVWNHPVNSYTIEFFDPIDPRRRSNSFRDVYRQRALVPNIVHGSYRSPKATFVVGVISTIDMASETKPGDNRYVQKQVVFVYDLELDANFRIVGGEWRDKRRPDFLWRPKDNQRPQAVGRDIQLDMWRMGDATWRQYSLENSAKGVPMKYFVEQLFQLAQ